MSDFKKLHIEITKSDYFFKQIKIVSLRSLLITVSSSINLNLLLDRQNTKDILLFSLQINTQSI